MKINTFNSMKLRKEIKNLNNHGSFIKSNSFNLKFTKNISNKIVFIIKKKIGNSPKRNKIKRQLRYIISKITFLENIHLMFIIKSSYNCHNFSLINQEVIKALEKMKKV